MIKIHKDLNLSKFTYTKQNIVVKNFIELDNIDLLTPLLKYYKKFIFIGNCSKTLFAFNNKDICLIRYVKKDIKIISNLLLIDSGASLSSIGEFALCNGIAGFEKIMTIPGFLGGSVYNNASCFNQEICENILFVEVYDTSDNKIKILKKDECEFGYRKSIFQNNQYLILRVIFRIKKALGLVLKNNLSNVIKLRNLSQPKGISYGSTFKNYGVLKARELVGNLNVESYDKVTLSKINSNFIILDFNFDYINIVKLIERINELLYNKLGITLESEIKIFY